VISDTRVVSKILRRRRRVTLNGRAAAGLAVLALAVVSVAEPIQTLIAQRAEISRVNAEILDRRAQITELESRQERLKDPAFIARLARERLHFVMPGEVGFVVLEPGEEDEAGVPLTLAEAAGLGPWWSRLWQGIQIADDPTRADQPTTDIAVRESAPR
jgi:cell division protein FtsB